MGHPDKRLDPRLLIALGLVVLYHGALLPYTLPNTYDSYIHMFFADHYNRSWFDPWEPRWYTGFATTSYPPGSHMVTALLQHVLPLKTAFIVVMVFGLSVLVLGVYRFSLLWVQRGAAGYAAIATVFASSIVETIHVFGQLPTIFSLGIFLNGLPHAYRWLVSGRLRELVFAVIFGAATTAAHHVTTIFGTVLFIGPIGLHAWAAYLSIHPVDQMQKKGLRKWIAITKPALRGIVLGVLLVGAIATTVFPYWYWSITDPITQVPIPHGSRESFIARPDLGLVFFIIPWGTVLFLLPYIAWKTFTTRLWPLGLSVLVCFVLGTGGTTPIPRMVLGGAFDILTLDRFTFWATILSLPFVGHLIDSLVHGRLNRILQAAFSARFVTAITILLFGGVIGFATFVASLPTFRPMQPASIDPAPIVKFMSEDDHEKWRYLTLGFGDQFAYLSAQMTAQSVDGNYHSARRLPDLTRYAIERLENSKYQGVPGLGSLQQFLVNAENYNLKYIFSNDAFYDPLLYFTGWNRLSRLQNGVVVWEKPDISPLPVVQKRRNIPTVYRLMWGILPPAALLTAYLALIYTVFLRGIGHSSEDYRQLLERSESAQDYGRLRLTVKSLFFGGIVIFLALAAFIAKKAIEPMSARETVTAYYTHLDFRRPLEAHALHEPGVMDEEQFLLHYRWTGGLIASYAKLTNIDVAIEPYSDTTSIARVTLDYLTPFGTTTKTASHELVKIGDDWFIKPDYLRNLAPTERLSRRSETIWSKAGRRQPENDDLHRDIMDRPDIDVLDARLVQHGLRFSTLTLVANKSADPASIKVRTTLLGANEAELSDRYPAEIGDHRLMPAEIGAFRTEFDALLDLKIGRALGAFDPELFIPPELKQEPSAMGLNADASVSPIPPYRAIAMTGLKVLTHGDGSFLEGLATNTGTEQADVIRFHVTLFGMDKRILWSDVAFSEEDLKPGESKNFAVPLPDAADIVIIGDVDPDHFLVNGLSAQNASVPFDPARLPGFIKLDATTGYYGYMLSAEAMTFQPLF